MPNMSDSLAALEGLTSNVRNPNSVVQHALLQRQRLNEMKRNLALRAPNFATGATDEDAAQLQDSLDTDPLVGVGEQNRIAGIQAQNDKDVRYNSPEALTQRKDALATALAPIQAKNQGELDITREKNKGLMDILASKQANQQEVLDNYASAGGGTSQGGLIPTIGPNGVTFKPKVDPQTVQAERHSAEVGLEMLPQLRQMVEALPDGAMGPLKQRVGSLAVASGLDPLLDTFGLLPTGAKEFDKFKGALTLAKSNLGKVHFGNRASAAIGAKFDEFLNPNQSKEALRGGLEIMQRWLSKYAGASKEEQDAGAAELGIQ